MTPAERLASITPEQREALFSLARDAGVMADRMVNSFSGTDQAESEAHYCARRVYVAVGHEGLDVEAAIEREDKRWRAYAAEQAGKVESAPKIKRGPSRGQSVISHRWVSPEKFSDMARHICTMVRGVFTGKYR